MCGYCPNTIIDVIVLMLKNLRCMSECIASAAARDRLTCTILTYTTLGCSNFFAWHIASSNNDQLSSPGMQSWLNVVDVLV
jgi:hypothetical protein